MLHSFRASSVIRPRQPEDPLNSQQITIAVVVLVAVVIGYRLVTRTGSTASRTPATPPDPNQFMPEFAAKAVATAADRGFSLDYTPSSVKSVEKVLGQLHDERTAGKLADKDVNVAALHYGGYIGEVLRRNYGGSWATDHKVAGPSTFPISWNGHDSFPVGWCGKRILNGDEDNVWFKYQVVTTDQGQSGIVAHPGGSPATAE